MARPLDSAINVEHVTLTFDLLLKIFNIGHKFLILRDREFIFAEFNKSTCDLVVIWTGML